MGSPIRAEVNDRVSRRRYERERVARKAAEELLEAKSRELFEAYQALSAQKEELQVAVQKRTLELEAAKTAAESASAAKSSFLAMISHEIRTPLNGVLGMATVLAESGLPHEQREMAEIIQSCGTSLLDLLNDLLDLSKIEASKMEIEFLDFDLESLCRDIRQTFEQTARSKGLGFTLRLDPDGASWVRCDPTRVRQVVINLISNAVKFTERGKVDVTLAKRAEHLEIRVSDTGPGVPEAQQSRLFEAFTQTDASITRKFGGTGLGLTISRRICRLLGGDLVYEAVPGGGACFVATVQLIPVQRKPVASVNTPEAADLLLREGDWRILVAEDSTTNQRVLSLLLKRYKLRLDIVADGMAAVETHCAAPYDLILMDVNMPVMNGLEAAAMIRQSEIAQDCPRVPIVALTANAMTHQVSSYLRQGIDAHVAKPIKRDELVAVMARLLDAQAE